MNRSRLGKLVLSWLAAPGCVVASSPGEHLMQDRDHIPLFQVILEVPDVREAVAFYVDALGASLVEPREYSLVDSAAFARLSTGGAFLALHGGGRLQRGAPTRLSFLVNDLATTREDLASRGLELGPVRWPAPGVAVADLHDPFGNVLHFEQHDRDPAGLR